MRRLPWLLASLTLLASVVFHASHLLTNPPSLFSDEVDAGYQAFVFNSCGNDYFGNRFPIHFQSFADWRTPLYLHAIALVQRVVGPNELSVRLPSLVFGLLSIIVFSLIIHHIFRRPHLTFVSFVLLSLNSWLFHYSRVAFEATGMLCSLLVATYFWFLYLQRQYFSRLVWSIIFFATAVYFYSTAKLFVPLLVLLILAIWFSAVRKFPRRHFLGAILVVLVVATPLIVDTIRGRAGYRFSYISILTQPTLATTVNYDRLQDLPFDNRQIGASPSFSSRFFHNKFTLTLTTFLRNYVSAFSVSYHLLTGDSNLRQGFDLKGNFYYLDFLLLFVGFTFIFKHLTSSKYLQFFFGWLILAPIPFALTRDVSSPQSTRLILMLVPLVFFIILGLQASIKLIPRRIFWLIFVFIYSLEVFSFHHFYYYHYPLLSARSWHYGMKQAVLDTAPLANRYSKIFYGSGNEPFLPFFYFYTRYLPDNGSCQPVANSPNYSNSYFSGRSIGHQYFFGPLEWSNLLSDDPDLDRYLFVVSSLELSRLNDQLNRATSYQKSIISYQLLTQPVKTYPDQEIYYYLTFQKKPISSSTSPGR